MKSKNAMPKTSAVLTVGATVMMINLAPATALLIRLLPSGVYANIYGTELYFGDFIQDPNPKCPVACSVAVRMNGKLSVMMVAQQRRSLK